MQRQYLKFCTLALAVTVKSVMRHVVSEGTACSSIRGYYMPHSSIRGHLVSEGTECRITDLLQTT